MTSLRAHEVALPGRLGATSMSASAGEMIAVIGPNGGGKTSLLRAIAGVEQAVGRVDIGGECLADLPEARRRTLLTFLPASRDLGWPIPARDVVAMGGNRRNAQLIDRVMEQMELEALADRPVNQLSTGERTRVLFARCLAAQPSLHLLDEPLSNLDPYWVLRFLDFMRAEAQRGAIVLSSLHDLSHLPRFDRAILVTDGQLQMDETPAILLESERFEQFFRIRRSGREWKISLPVDQQSSP